MWGQLDGEQLEDIIYPWRPTEKIEVWLETVFDGTQVESNLVYYQLMVAVKNIQGKAVKGNLVTLCHLNDKIHCKKKLLLMKGFATTKEYWVSNWSHMGILGIGLELACNRG